MLSLHDKVQLTFIFGGGSSSGTFSSSNRMLAIGLGITINSENRFNNLIKFEKLKQVKQKFLG